MIKQASRRGLRSAALTTTFLALLGLSALPARAELQVNVTQGVTDPIPIAIVPFARAVPADGGLDIAGVVQHDLESSGRFRAMQRRDMLATPTKPADVQAADWKAAGNDYVLVGRVTAPSASELNVECDLINTLTGQRIGGKRFVANGLTLRNAAHMVSDFVYESILGVRGAFATRVAYVAVQGQAPSQHFQLIVADSDGESPRVILESAQPIMSPTWSPDDQWLAYVSFENRLSAVYIQRVRTGERRLLSQRLGVNGAPAFSPDAHCGRTNRLRRVPSNAALFCRSRLAVSASRRRHRRCPIRRCAGALRRQGWGIGHDTPAGRRRRSAQHPRQ
jgi:TolB protein